MAVTPIKIMGAYTLINDVVGESDSAYSVDKISTDVINDNDVVMAEDNGGMYFYNAVTYPFEITEGDDLPYYIRPNDEIGFQRWTLMNLYGKGLGTDSLSANNGSIINVYDDVNVLNNLYANYTGTTGLSAVNGYIDDLMVSNNLTVTGESSLVGHVQISGRLRSNLYASNNTYKIIDNGTDGSDVKLNAIGITGTAIKDEDNLISNSAFHLASQQSIKAYIDFSEATILNKTLVSPILSDPIFNTSVNGDAVKLNMNENSNQYVVTQQGIKSYVDIGTVTMINKTLTSPIISSPTISSPTINTSIGGNAVKTSLAENSDSYIATQKGIKTYIDGTVNTAVTGAELVGGIVMWPMASPPAGYLECNGAAVSRTTYSNLFAVIGTTYGYGNGSSTFNIPDYRGQFMRGWAHGLGEDPDRASRTNRGDGVTGDNVGTRQADQYRSHYHTTGPIPSGLSTYAGVRYKSRDGGYLLYNRTGYSGGSETRARNVNIMFAIKY